MNKGSLAIVLHAHLPYVRSEEPGSLEEDWFFQALIECYLPLLDTLQRSTKNKEEDPKITVGLSPTLLSLLEDQQLKKRFPKWISIRLEILDKINKDQKECVVHLLDHFNKHLRKCEDYKGDLINQFSK